MNIRAMNWYSSQRTVLSIIKLEPQHHGRFTARVFLLARHLPRCRFTTTAPPTLYCVLRHMGAACGKRPSQIYDHLHPTSLLTIRILVREVLFSFQIYRQEM